MKLEPDCLFSSLSDTCHTDEDDHPHHESCYIHTHPHTYQYSSSSGQLNQKKIFCRQKIITDHENNESSRHSNAHTNLSIFKHNDKYSTKRCHKRFLSLPILLILVLSMPSIIHPISAMQKGAALQKQEQIQQKDQLIETEEDPESCRLEDSIPGTPGDDYPTYTDIPETAFKCSDKQFPGYYADVDAQCQVFHVCQADGRKDSFLCPVGTIFNQELFVCDWWNNFRCQDAGTFSDLNSELYITPEVKKKPNSNLLKKRTNNYELDNNSVNSDEREREDSIEDDDDDREVFEERITVTAAPLQARKGLLSDNFQTKSELQQQEVKGRIQDIKGKQQEVKGRQQEVKGRQQEVKGRQQEVKGRQQEVKGKIQETKSRQQDTKGRQQAVEVTVQRQDVKTKAKQQQEVKGKLKEEIKGELRTPNKAAQVKGNRQEPQTRTTFGARTTANIKSSKLSSTRTLVENFDNDWDDEIGSTDAITTPEVTTASWTFKPTPTPITTTTARIVSDRVIQSRPELKSPGQLRNSVKYQRQVGDGKEEFVYWDSRFDNQQQRSTIQTTTKPTTTTERAVSDQVIKSWPELNSPSPLKSSVEFERQVDGGREDFVYWDSRFDNQQQTTKSQFQNQMLEQQRQQDPVQQRITSSRLEIDHKWTPMITPYIQEIKDRQQETAQLQQNKDTSLKQQVNRKDSQRQVKGKLNQEVKSNLRKPVNEAQVKGEIRQEQQTTTTTRSSANIESSRATSSPLLEDAPDWWNTFRCQDGKLCNINSGYVIPPQGKEATRKANKANNFEFDDNSESVDSREREDTIEDDEADREIFEERISVTAAPIQARKGSLNFQTKSELQQQEVKSRVRDIKGKQQEVKAKQKEVKGKIQESKSGQQNTKITSQRQEVKSKLNQEVKSDLKKPVKATQVKGKLQEEQTRTTYGTRLSGRTKSAKQTSSRTLVEISPDNWDDEISSTAAITTPEATTGTTSWTLKPTATTGSASRVVSTRSNPAAYKIFKTLKPRSTSAAPVSATSSSTATSSITISIMV